MYARAAAALAILLVSAGCISLSDALNQNALPSDVEGAITPVRERADLPFVTDDKWSHTLEEGVYGILDALSVYVDVQVPVGNGLPVQQAHMGVFLPDIPGCDWEASTLPDECKVPIVADVGPYYADGDLEATNPETARLGGFLIENLVPHGYAVAQVSVLGTGLSGGCMDLMGEVEQAGVQAAVEWLGTQSWSNGAVGLIGRSYDGSTPWEAAMIGSDYLKTIVPISGLYGQHDLMWRNGSAEFRGPGVLWALYYTFALSPAEGTGPGVFGPLVPTTDYAPTHAQRVAENTICPDTQAGGAQAVAAYVTGDRVVPEVNGYWMEREFRTEVLENYEGSVYFIHGMQDWNVDPHMAFPFYQELEAKGLEMKGFFGQWAHNYPDRLEEHESCDGRSERCAAPYSVRYDWAQDLLEWFDHYLKGTGPKPELHVEIQDNLGAWRIEETYPPRDVAWTEFALGDALTLEAGDGIITPTSSFGVASFTENPPAGVAVYRTEALENPLRIVGLPQFHVTVTPLGPGGQLYAELRDADDGGKHLGHAIMDLRYAAGGDEFAPVVPGQPLEVKMEFFPMDVVVPAGHRIELYVANAGEDYLPSVTSAPVVIDEGVLRLSTVERGADAFFQPPGVPALESVMN